MNGTNRSQYALRVLSHDWWSPFFFSKSSKRVKRVLKNDAMTAPSCWSDLLHCHKWSTTLGYWKDNANFPLTYTWRDALFHQKSCVRNAPGPFLGHLCAWWMARKSELHSTGEHVSPIHEVWNISYTAVVRFSSSGYHIWKWYRSYRGEISHKSSVVACPSWCGITGTMTWSLGLLEFML